MLYGLLCFGLLFSVAGTMLGGVWANACWGRFWGWDPKENAALMVCLWEIAMLQASMAGYIRGPGLALGAVLLGGVVVFSWWGVNFLNIGLHSYGSIPGVLPNLIRYAAVESLLLLAWAVAQLVGWLARRQIAAVGSAA